jgi:hypothetical protein
MTETYIDTMSEVEIKNAQATLLHQCNDVDWIKNAFDLAWLDFKDAKFSYDGATFVREHENNFWEVAAFIHDWLNSIGHVGKGVDLYFIKIMITLNYGEHIIFERCKWMQWTWINVFKHRYLTNSFKSTQIPGYLL